MGKAMIEALRGFDRRRLGVLLEFFHGLRVAVFGDFFLDKYLEVDPSLAEKSLETGQTAHQVVAVKHAAGAAGTVMNNLASLGTGRLLAVGCSGDDGEGYELRQDLKLIDVDCTHLHLDPERRTPTYLKPRDQDRPGLAGEHSRYDMKNRVPTPSAIQDRICASLRSLPGTIDALVVMDQVEDDDYGAVTSSTVNLLAELLPRHPSLVAWADSRRRIMSFSGLMLKMNQFELTGKHDPVPGALLSDAEIIAAQGALEKKIRRPVFVTAGEKGVWIGGATPELIPALRLNVPVDPTGAGDSFTAGAVLALAAGATGAEAALVGNLVASVTVRKLGTTGTATGPEVLSAFDLWKEQNS
jgi:sugar/nucleoside kinase (ribokinase family)